MEGWQAKPDGVVWWFCTRQLPPTMHDGTFSTAPSYLHLAIPLLWRGGRRKHFVMHAFNNHVEVLHNVTPIDLPAQSAVLSDGVVASRLQ